MKNLLLLLFFTVLSAFLLALMMVLAFLPRICSCFRRICHKQHETLSLQRQRARQIKQTRLKIAYQTQILHEKPCNEDLEISRGVFFDEALQKKTLDKASLLLYKTEIQRNKTLERRFDRALSSLNRRLHNVFAGAKYLLRALFHQMAKPASKFLNH